MATATQIGLGGPNQGAPVPPPPTAAVGVKPNNPLPPPLPAARPPRAQTNPLAPSAAEPPTSATAITQPTRLPHLPPSAVEPPAPGRVPPAQPAHGRTVPNASSLLRGSENPTPAGRYSLRAGVVDRIDAAPEHAPQAAPLSPTAEDDEAAARARRFTPKQRPAQRRGRNKFDGRTTAPSRSRDERSEPGRRNDERPEFAPTLPEMAAVRASTLQGRPALLLPADTAPTPQARSRQVTPSDRTQELPRVRAERAARRDSTVFVDPQLQADPNRRPGRPARRDVPFEPLPSDRAGFEAFMQRRRLELENRRPGLHWNEQETELISRETLAMEPVPWWRGRMPLLSAIAALVVVAIGALVLLLGNGGSAGGPVHPVPLSTAANKAHVTVIATEPSGAELLAGGAVLGNTPLEVARPRRGEQTYLVRMQGFDAQLIRLTPDSRDAIHVTLLPSKR